MSLKPRKGGFQEERNTISERPSKVRIGKWPLHLKPWGSFVTFVRIIFYIKVRRYQVLNPRR